MTIPGSHSEPKKTHLRLFRNQSLQLLHGCLQQSSSPQRNWKAEALQHLPDPGNGYISHLGKLGKSASICHFGGGYVSSLEGIPMEDLPTIYDTCKRFM